MPDTDCTPERPDPEELHFGTLTSEQLAPLFPRLEIGEPLAVGGMGAVFIARQPELDRLVALKILPPELCAEAEYVERFRAEARAMAQLNHVNLVGVHDFGEVSGYFYFIMEFVEGQNLAALLESYGKFGPEFVLPVMLHICDGIAYAHGKGVVHLDLKPGNIMLDNEGLVKTLDFGLAKLLDPKTGSAQENMGTPDYAAPERFTTGAAIDHRADIYSIGVVLREMLVGSARRISPEPVSKLVSVDPSVDKIIAKCTEADPAARYNSAAELRADLAKAEKRTQQALLKSPNAAKLLSGAGGPQVAAAANKFRKRLRRKMLFRKLRNLIVLLAVLAGVAAVAWKMNLIPNEILEKLGLPLPPAAEEQAEELPPMFPELKKLHITLQGQLELGVEERNDEVKTLAGKYRNALTKLRDGPAGNGSGELVSAIDSELERFEKDGGAPDELSSLGDLAKPQTVLRDELAKIDAKAETERKRLLELYDRALGHLHETVSGEGRSEDAARIEEERQRIRASL